MREEWRVQRPIVRFICRLIGFGGEVRQQLEQEELIWLEDMEIHQGPGN